MVKIKSATENLNERLGADCKLPINGSFEPITGTELLLQDIQQLLLTLPGERVQRPLFGCKLRSYIWENIEVAQQLGAASITSALVNFEPRIIVNSVTSTVNTNTSLIIFTVSFVVRATDTSLNLIFPFRVGTTLSFA
jgi:phage baseplate assembly protein W